MIKLLENATANTAAGFIGFGTQKGGFSSIFAWGTWGGAQIDIQASPDNGVTWISTGILFTVDGMSNLDLAYRRSDLRFRAHLTGAGTTDINVKVF